MEFKISELTPRPLTKRFTAMAIISSHESLSSWAILFARLSRRALKKMASILVNIETWGSQGYARLI